jgi:hypothetical protein
MEKKTVVIIFLLFFLFSSRMWEITWDIGKALLYIMLGLFILNFLDRELSGQVKQIIMELINIDSYNINKEQRKKYNNIIIDYIYSILSYIMSFFEKKIVNPSVVKLNEIIKDTQEYDYKNITNNFLNDNQYTGIKESNRKDDL